MYELSFILPGSDKRYYYDLPLLFNCTIHAVDERHNKYNKSVPHVSISLDIQKTEQTELSS